jgi:hydrogenase maturation factor
LDILNQDVSFEINESRIPFRPIVSRFAQVFGFDPLQMISSGTLVATVPKERMEAATRVLEDLGVPFADVGWVIQGRGVTFLREGETITYHEIRCEEDELARMWALYPRDG